MAGNIKDWSSFVKDGLLDSGLFSGVGLITKQSKPTYTYGSLTDIEQSCWKQFCDLFQLWSSTNEQVTSKNQLSLTFKDSKHVSYKIYKKTFCSVYATSERNQEGLVVCNLPYGILIVTHSQPQPGVKAIKLIEQFCDQLRR
ncbi:unnamed protein product [Owenia fusiformis]|uniref:Uncharacterized protein n=1 Tax=Owenia fusiformis TaxID=6347 RepID=A0A8J1U4G1_OWEFU|nr:unnamed protein product [Owenia fusiformis]